MRVATVERKTKETKIKGRVALDGTGVQLGNQGGTLTLQDSHNAQVDVVIYTAQDASIESRYVRFRH